MSLIFIGGAVAITAVVILHGLSLSHRIAGPVHRLKEFLRARSRDGVETDFKTRQGDFCDDLNASVNEALRTRPKSEPDPEMRKAG